MLAVAVTVEVQAQTGAGGVGLALDRYVAEALASNLALQQRRYDLAASRQALSAAHRRFLPALSVEARYTRAGGGRTIDLPLGDLLNPAYATLNDLLVAQGEAPAFPRLENEEIRFIREREQDTRLRLIQPLYQPRLSAALRLQQHLVTAQHADVDAYRHELVRDVKVAYFSYLKAEQAVAIYEAGAALVAENLRTVERLQAAGRVLPDAVSRARTETFTVAQDVAEAQKERDRARAYVNFLRNQPLDTPLETLPEATLPAIALPDAAPTLLRTAAVVDAPRSADPLVALQDTAVARRLELDRLDALVDAQTQQVALQRAAYLPGVSLALEGGIQGADYGFRGDRPFYLASVVLSWRLFDGGADRAQVRQARIAVDRTRVQRDEAAQRIRLQTQDAYDAVRVARTSLAAAEERLASAREGFRLVARRVAEGRANQVQFVDARTVLTQAELNLSVTRYDLLARLADLDYALGRSDRHIAG